MDCKILKWYQFCLQNKTLGNEMKAKYYYASE